MPHCYWAGTWWTEPAIRNLGMRPSNGSPPGDEDARKARDIVAAGMTREQSADAQARAREWANR